MSFSLFASSSSLEYPTHAYILQVWGSEVRDGAAETEFLRQLCNWKGKYANIVLDYSSLVCVCVQAFTLGFIWQTALKLCS